MVGFCNSSLCRAEQDVQRGFEDGIHTHGRMLLDAFEGRRMLIAYYFMFADWVRLTRQSAREISGTLNRRKRAHADTGDVLRYAVRHAGGSVRRTVHD